MLLENQYNSNKKYKWLIFCSDKKKEEDRPQESESKKDPSQPLKLNISSEQVELQIKAKEFLKQKSSEGDDSQSKHEFVFSGSTFVIIFN